MNILLLDDRLKHRRAGVRQLTRLGYDVAPFNSYVEARECAEKNHFDAALIDLLMPAEGMILGQKGMNEFLGQSMPFGFPMAIGLALLGIPKILVATATHQQDHPMSAILTWFAGQRIQVSGSEVIFVHALLAEEGVKDWEKMLDLLLNEGKTV